MKLGLGLYKHMLTPANFRFARQAGCTHIVAHLVDYFAGGRVMPNSRDAAETWGVSANAGALWTVEELRALKAAMAEEGLELAAIENFDPSHWHDVLLDGPKRARQIEDIKTMVRRVGEAGIPVIGYNFSLAGVWGHHRGPHARGGAESVGFETGPHREEPPIPKGTVWNMVYDPSAPAGVAEPPITHEELWRRLEGFLREVVPVAEEAGVVLAAHPDDPPMPTLRGQPRLVHQPSMYQRLLDAAPSPSNQLEFCLGSLAEMTEGDVYQAIEQYAGQRKVAYVHFRNVRGKVPAYHEVFVDEGDIDMVRALRLLAKHGFEGVLVPDHTPHLDCSAGWHAGMAYALGFMRGALAAMEP